MLLHPRCKGLPGSLIQHILEFLYPQLKLATDAGSFQMSVAKDLLNQTALCFFNIKEMPRGFSVFMRNVSELRLKASLHYGFELARVAWECTGVVLTCPKAGLRVIIQYAGARVLIHKTPVAQIYRKKEAHYIIRPSTARMLVWLTKFHWQRTPLCKRCAADKKDRQQDRNWPKNKEEVQLDQLCGIPTEPDYDSGAESSSDSEAGCSCEYDTDDEDCECSRTDISQAEDL